MIDPNHPTVRSLSQQGYSLAGHWYLQPDGTVRFSFAATNRITGARLQGWSRNGSAEDALRDLVRRAGLSQANAG